jgi:hypothetical protein
MLENYYSHSHLNNKNQNGSHNMYTKQLIKNKGQQTEYFHRLSNKGKREIALIYPNFTIKHEVYGVVQHILVY